MPQAIAMRRIASELGAGTMSLYWHVANKEQLIDLVLDAIVGEAGIPGPPSGEWRRDLETIATNTREALRRHPWVLRFIASWPWFGPNMLHHEESMLAAFDGLGIDPATAMAMASTVDTYVVGFGMSEVRSAEARAQFERGEARITAAELEEILAGGSYPRFARYVAEGATLTADQQFAMGLGYILDGIAQRIAEVHGRSV